MQFSKGKKTWRKGVEYKHLMAKWIEAGSYEQAKT